LRGPLVENDAAAVRDGQAGGRGHADAANDLRADLPLHAVDLTVMGDLDDARISRAPGIHAARIVDAGDRLVGGRHARAQGHRCDQRERNELEGMQGNESAHRSRSPVEQICSG
jgi:hypothetical protein